MAPMLIPYLEVNEPETQYLLTQLDGEAEEEEVLFSDEFIPSVSQTSSSLPNTTLDQRFYAESSSADDENPEIILPPPQRV
ncbi:hypothetical protein [Croceiramulus getboli]|nr:hypothetical protein P8624_08775 [Flavobacteriaceae bacterium YJPT1-3]